ncbi:hypothetical protein [Haloferula sp. A504]|uniref:hypothetical protein n=1 Tax=Haloferula sp. A504 TaxID=3373601 RepID=UPI0031C509A4|nr:hypothetical protein [Verrucomicrobiaceae bacterium E54]
MMAHSGDQQVDGDRKRAFILALWLAFPSFGFVQEHAGTWVIVPYLAGVVAVVLLGWHRLPLPERWLGRHFGWVVLACLIGMAVAHVALHPFEDGRGAGFSSDRDEALEIAVGRLIDGEYPYYPQGEGAGPLSVLPGGILLAAPFVLIGKVGLINVAWLAGFLLVMRRELGSAAWALWMLGASLVVSPAAAYEFVSGGDLLANAIYVSVGCWWCLRLWSEEKLRVWRALGAAAFLGIAVASRASFPLLCPLVVAWLWQRAGIVRAAGCAAVTAGVSLGLIGGFYLSDPESFTPFGSRNKLVVHGAPEWLQHAILAATLIAVGCFTIAFLARWCVADRQQFFRASAWITSIPLAGMILAASVLGGRIDFSILHDRFGLMCVPFALLGWGGVAGERRGALQAP